MTVNGSQSLGLALCFLVICKQTICAEQGLVLVAMYTAAKLHAHPFERAWLLLPFFLGAAEIASGVSGL